MNLRETIAGVRCELSDAGIESPAPEAELLVAAAAGRIEESRAQLLQAGDLELSTAQARALASMVLRRTAGEPVQYLVGLAWFRDLILEVGPGVLVPRPETEVLAGEVIDWLSAREPSPRKPAAGEFHILDVGTGSGCLALAIATEERRSRVLATDISPDALAYARKNRDRVARGDAEAASRVEFAESDLLGSIPEGARFDVIVSNPPYIAPEERESLPQNVREHEPPVALFAEEGGTRVITTLIRQAPEILLPNGLLALEIGESQADNVGGQIDSLGSFEPAWTVQDLTGRTRIVLAKRSP